MATAWTFDVRRSDPREHRLVEVPLPESGGARTLLRVDSFALTTNNLTYAATGESLGYWRLFPRPEPWGTLPAWGVATVVEGDAPGPGTRLYGFVPTATHAAMELRAGRALIREVGAERAALEPAYNAYVDVTSTDDHALALRAGLHPLFALGHALAGYLDEQDGFGADRIVITSASSKAALCTAFLTARRRPTLGMTGPGHRDFVLDTGLYSDVVPYGDELPDDGGTTVVVDVSGDERRLAAVRAQLGDRVRHVVRVGGTGAGGRLVSAPAGAAETVFFGPAQMAAMARRLGAAQFGRDLEERFAEFTEAVRQTFRIERFAGRDGMTAAYERVLAGGTPPHVLTLVVPDGGPA